MEDISLHHPQIGDAPSESEELQGIRSHSFTRKNRGRREQVLDEEAKKLDDEFWQNNRLFDQERLSKDYDDDESPDQDQDEEGDENNNNAQNNGHGHGEQEEEEQSEEDNEEGGEGEDGEDDEDDGDYEGRFTDSEEVVSMSDEGN